VIQTPPSSFIIIIIIIIIIILVIEEEEEEEEEMRANLNFIIFQNPCFQFLEGLSMKPMKKKEV
jgi:hypothetical protein